MLRATDVAIPERRISTRACTLDQLEVGRRGRVVGVTGEADVRRRLLEMGFCNRVVVEVVRRAPLGDPIEYRLRGYHLSLREQQARHIRVIPSDGDAS